MFPSKIWDYTIKIHNDSSIIIDTRNVNQMVEEAAVVGAGLVELEVRELRQQLQAANRRDRLNSNFELLIVSQEVVSHHSHEAVPLY